MRPSTFAPTLWLLVFSSFAGASTDIPAPTLLDPDDVGTDDAHDANEERDEESSNVRRPNVPGDDRSDENDNNDDNDDNELSYLERFHPFTVNRDLAPIVDENMAVFFAAGCLFPIGGNVWIPALFVGDPPEGYWSDALMAFVAHLGTSVLVAVVLALATVVFQPLAAAYWPLVALFVAVNAFYLMPAATMNAYSRAFIDADPTLRAARDEKRRAKAEAEKARKLRREKRRTVNDDGVDGVDDDENDMPAWMKDDADASKDEGSDDSVDELAPDALHDPAGAAPPEVEQRF